jgi:hypothetical protein
MPGWNLLLRFLLEIAALVGIALGVWSIATGAWRWVVATAATLLAVTLWGVFNVEGDPSRSGRAPFPVSGRTRLAVELVILGAGGVGLLATVPLMGVLTLCGLVLHYGFGWRRVCWLLRS